MTASGGRPDIPDLSAEAIAAIRRPRAPRPLSLPLIGTTGGVILVLAALLAVFFAADAGTYACGESDVWAPLWLAFTPLIAGVSVLAMVIATRGAGRPGVSLLVGVLLSWAISYVVAGELERACVTSNLPYAVTVIVLPAAVGIAAVVVPLVLLRALRRAP